MEKKNHADSYAVLKTTVRSANLGIFLGVSIVKRKTSPKERSDNDAKLKKVLDTIAAMDDSQVADAFAKAESDDSANTAAVSSGDFERGIRQHISAIIEKCKEDVRNGQNR